MACSLLSCGYASELSRAQINISGKNPNPRAHVPCFHTGSGSFVAPGNFAGVRGKKLSKRYPSPTPAKKMLLKMRLISGACLVFELHGNMTNLEF